MGGNLTHERFSAMKLLEGVAFGFFPTSLSAKG